MFTSENKTGTLVMYNAETGAAQDTGRRAMMQQYRGGHALGASDTGDLRTAFIYLIISIALAIFGAVYEHFSFGVYSYFMIYAFAIPLIGGALPFMLKYLRDTRRMQNTGAGYRTGGSAYYERSGIGPGQQADRYIAAKQQYGKINAYDSTANQELSGPGLSIGRAARLWMKNTDAAAGGWLWHAGIATLTTGSIMRGILAICGRPNSLTVIYLIAGAAILIAATVSHVPAIVRNRQ